MKSRAPLRDLVAAAGVLNSCAAWAAKSSTSIFSSSSTPAREVQDLSYFVLAISAGIFLGVSGLLVYALIRYRARGGEATEPPQVFGSTQIELAWTIIPVLIIVTLFLGTARVLFSVQDARKPPTAVEVTVVGHQFWWEFHYPQYKVVAANEMHVPVSSAASPRPTFMKLTSADVIHSFWVPQLAGKTDLLPNRVNEMWIDPQITGLYVGQCAQFCGVQHAKMLLRVYVDTPEQFQQWIAQQQKVQSEKGGPQSAAATRNLGAAQEITARDGKLVFEQQACINCHAVAGTVSNGRFGPDLTHLMSRETLAAGAMPNTPENLKAWIEDPNTFKPGTLMPAMHLSDQQNAQITAYLLTLK
ncbi:MAG TPA: cytochrome c oxidase subunit II [Terracidiphilus sp.]|nr:cytochrome c oxidase subunit II [Terracidiphilus sp.]